MIKVHLKDVLKAKGMTNKELAAMIDITEANLSILCSGKAKAIRFSTLEKICKVLDCEIKDILSFEKDERED